MSRLLLLCFIFLLDIAPAFAEVPSNQFVYLNGAVGFYSPMNGQQGTQLALGAGLGFRSSRSWSWGAFIQNSSQSITLASANPTTTQASNTLYGLEGTYYIESLDFMPGLNIGLKAGMLHQSLSSDSTILGLPVSQTSESTDLIVGPKIGYEYTFDIGIALGGEMSILRDISNGDATPFSLLGTLRVWF